MIVKCEQCQTKFKIPDDKVTDKGVKVRCTKCGHTFRVMKEAGAAAPVASVTTKMPAVALDSADPFSKFGEAAANAVPKAEQTRPGVFALGVEASRMPELAKPAVRPAPASAGPSPFDFGSLAPPAAAPPPRPSAATTQPVAPFDFASLMGPPSPGAPPAASPPTRAAAPPPGPAPFDFSALTAPPPPPPPPAPAPAPRMSAPARPVDAPAMSFDFSSLGPSATPGASQPAPANELLAGLPPAPSGGGLLDDLPSPTPGGALLDDPFGSSSAAMPSVPANASKEEARHALFDMSVAAAPIEDLSQAVAYAPAPSAPQAVVPVSSPSTTVPAVPRPPDPSTERGRRALGIVVNVMIAAVLVVGVVVVTSATMNEGKLDVQSIVTSLKSLVTPASDFVADDISNGLYDTKMGRPVFFVRGVVTNRSAGSTRVRVKAEILDGATLVRSAEVMAGAPPSPEELFLLAEAAQLKTLMERSSTKAPAIGPGDAAAFLVTFAEYPPDLKAFRVRVTAQPEGQPTAAASP